MGSSSQPSTQTVTNVTKLPEWVEKASEENFNYAKDLSTQLPGAYQGNTVAGLDAMNPAFDLAKSIVGSQSGAMQSAQDAAATAAGYTPQNVQAGSFLTGDVGAYMNPYIQNVEQAALTNMQDGLARNINQIGQNATTARAFGGSRQGVMEGAAAAQTAKDFGDLSARLRSQAFDSASGMMRSDMDRALQAGAYNQQAGLTGNQQRIQAASTGGQLAQAAQGMQYTDLASLYNVGEQQRNYEQSLLGQDAARWDANKAAMLEPLNLRLSALGMSPYGQSQTQTGPAPQGNSTLSTLGTIGSIGASAATIIAAF